MKTFLSILFIWTLAGCASQQQVKIDSILSKIKFPIEISGIVKDSLTNKPVGYTQVVVHQNRSTTSSMPKYDGSFTLRIYESYLEEGHILKLETEKTGYLTKRLELVMDKSFKNEPITILISPRPDGWGDAGHFDSK